MCWIHNIIYTLFISNKTTIENLFGSLANLEDGQKIFNEYKSSHPEFSSSVFENVFYKRIMVKINKMFNFDEPDEPNEPDESENSMNLKNKMSLIT